jgi:hypothetical protein
LPLAGGGHVVVPGVVFIPGEVLLPWLPEVEGVELDDPLLGAEPGVPFAVLGMVPHGDVLGELPGLLGLFGFTVDGCAVFPVAEGLVGFAPGIPGEEELGVTCPGVVCGVVAPVGGFTAPVGGAVGEPAVGLCPAVLEPPAGRAPPELWANAQLAQHSTTDNNVSFRDDIKGLQSFRTALLLLPRAVSELTIIFELRISLTQSL